MEENLEFTFKATALLKKRDGSSEKKEVKITGLASDEEGFMDGDFDLEMESGEYLHNLSYAHLSHIRASK